MKLLAALLLASCAFLNAEDWRLAKELDVTKEFVNVEVGSTLVAGQKVATIQSKVLFSRGGIILTTYYFRKREGQWESATKSTKEIHKNGSLRKETINEDSKLIWTAFGNPPRGPWEIAQSHAAAILSGK